MLILAFDTATPQITVAVHDGTRVVGRAGGQGAMAHGELLAPAIAEAMRGAGAAMADLTDVAVGVGPGPFTGLRVGVVTALTLAQTLGLTAHGRCTLDVVAAAVPAGREFVVAIDARRKEVYWARYDQAGRRVGEPSVDRPAVVADLGLPVHGQGGQIYRDQFAAGGLDLEPDAGVLATLVADADTRYPDLRLEPLYLRRPDAQPLASVPSR